MLPVWKKNNNKESSKKRKPNLVKKLDKVFALYIRLRDVMPSGYGMCISCGRIKHFKDLDCGHFHGRMHMATRYDEDNCWAECAYCNRMSSDHLIKYRDNLIQKIGIKRYEKLNVLAHSTKHWLDFELQEKIEYYTKEVKRMSSEKGIKVNL